MDKAEVEKIFGKPYKIAFAKDDNGDRIDSLFYKEHVYTAYQTNIVENILIFKNEKLVQLAQGKGYAEGETNTIIKN